MINMTRGVRVMYKTLKVRIKDKHSKVLSQMARDVNTVFNYSQDLALQALKKERKFLSNYDIHKFTKGSSEVLSINAQSVQAVSTEYVTRRKQFKKVKLRWRASYGTRKALGWVPFNGQTIKFNSGQLVYNKVHIGLWDSYGLSGVVIKTGCFTEDARGRWYACLVVKLDTPVKKTEGVDIGIDLGLKDLATTSEGEVIGNPKYFKQYQDKLAKAQRANKKKLARSIHAKIKNCRLDYLHKESTKLVTKAKRIVVGNLNLKASKSVNDTGFAGFRSMLEYKCKHTGIDFEEVNESYTTQTCSNCGSLPDSRPKGIAGLGIREWTCSDCGAVHDRDINAAKNILALGHERLAVGIPVGRMPT